MKWSPQEAIALHAIKVLVSAKAKPEDVVAARRALAEPFGEEALEALGDEDLERLEREVQAQLEASARGRCVTCGARCMACAMRDAEHSPPVDGEAGGWGYPGVRRGGLNGRDDRSGFRSTETCHYRNSK